jgi:hypothetical protein
MADTLKKKASKNTEPKKIGRPSISTLYSDELAAEICRRMVAGESINEICRDPAMPVWDTVWRWKNSNLDFSAQYARAMDERGQSLGLAVPLISDEEPERDDNGRIDSAWVNRQKMRVDARKWAAARMAPKHFGDRSTQTINGPDNGAIEIRLFEDKARETPHPKLLELKAYLQNIMLLP